MGQCKQCGLCCKALMLGFTMAQCQEKLHQYRENTSMRKHYEFVVNNLEELTIDQAFAINPYLEEEGKRRGYTREFMDTRMHFFSCKLLGEDNECTAYESRPEMCSGFPWYDETYRSKERLFTDQCGFMDETDEVRGVLDGVKPSEDDCKKCKEAQPETTQEANQTTQVQGVAEAVMA